MTGALPEVFRLERITLSQSALQQTREIFTAADIGGSGRNIWLLGPDNRLCSTDAPHSISASASFALPFGRGKQLLGNASGFVNQLVGGWRGNLVFIASSGYPVTIPCTISTTSGSGCNAIQTGQPLYPKNRTFNQWWNPAAFTNPPVATTLGQTDLSPLGGWPAQVRGPYYRRADLSMFKEFPVKESQRFEFRAEIFNLPILRTLVLLASPAETPAYSLRLEFDPLTTITLAALPPCVTAKTMRDRSSLL